MAVGGGGDDVAIKYETDEEEFLDECDCNQATELSVKTRDTRRQERSARRVGRMGYDLAYFNLWWFDICFYKSLHSTI